MGQRFRDLFLRLVVSVGVLGMVLMPRSVVGHEDPPTAPKIIEYLWLEELTLKTDQDDGVNGETEIIIRGKITHPGHDEGQFVLVVEDIDMDPPNETSFTVLDGSQTAPERRGGRKLMYLHIECTPRAPMVLDLDVIEVNTTSAGDIVRAMGDAAAGTTSSGLAKGASFVGAIAALIGGIIDAIGNDETNLGTASLIIPDGVSAEDNPTVNYGYKTNLQVEILDPLTCDPPSIPSVEGALTGGFVPSDAVPAAEAIVQGFDATHPFTKNLAEATVRAATLVGVHDLIALYVEQPGETQENAAAHRALMADTTAQIARFGLVAERDEATLGGVDPALVAQAQQILTDGDAIAVLDPQLATDTYMQGVLLLLPANHPDFQPPPGVPTTHFPVRLAIVMMLAGVGAALLAWRVRTT